MSIVYSSNCNSNFIALNHLIFKQTQGTKYRKTDIHNHLTREIAGVSAMENVIVDVFISPALKYVTQLILRACKETSAS